MARSGRARSGAGRRASLPESCHLKSERPQRRGGPDCGEVARSDRHRLRRRPTPDAPHPDRVGGQGPLRGGSRRVALGADPGTGRQASLRRATASYFAKWLERSQPAPLGRHRGDPGEGRAGVEAAETRRLRAARAVPRSSGWRRFSSPLALERGARDESTAAGSALEASWSPREHRRGAPDDDRSAHCDVGIGKFAGRRPAKDPDPPLQWIGRLAGDDAVAAHAGRHRRRVSRRSFGDRRLIGSVPSSPEEFPKPSRALGSDLPARRPS